MIPSKHPRCVHPEQGLSSAAFQYTGHLATDIRQRFAKARDDLQRPRFKLVSPSPTKPRNKPSVKPIAKTG